jgi:hypothetical protein
MLNIIKRRGIVIFYFIFLSLEYMYVLKKMQRNVHITTDNKMKHSLKSYVMRDYMLANDTLP